MDKDEFIKRVISYGVRNGLNLAELGLFLSNPLYPRCSNREYKYFCAYFKDQKHVDAYYAKGGSSL